MKKLLLFLFLSICISSFSKTIFFAYDSSGNRVQRLINMPSRTAQQTDTTSFIAESIDKFEIKIYPNPTKGQLRIAIPNLGTSNICSFQIYRLDGKCLLSEYNSGPISIIDISSFSAGLYLLEITIGEDLKTWKIIKE